jgi:SAM-dependent methyltransferase
LNQEADFALLFAVAHEVPDRDALFSNLHKMLKNGGLLLFSEPSGHVNVKDFEASVSLAQKAGFKVKSQVKVSRSHSVLLEK